MASEATDTSRRRFRVFQGVLPIDRVRVPTEVLAGVTLAALAIPEVMGYATIAGMPVITGLYTILIPMLAFAVFGSSRHLVVGADSATAAVMAAGLVGLAATGSSEYVALAGLLALMAAGFLLFARVVRLGLPSVMWSDIPPLMATAGSIFILILAQSAATSRAYAARYNDRFSENVDLVGLGAANIFAGLSGTFVVNGSPTKTQMVDGAGGRSQLAQISTGGIVLIVVLFLTKPIQYMPSAVLAAVVFLIGIELVDVAGMREILRLRRDEFVR